MARFKMENPPINYHRGKKGEKSRMQVGTMLETCTKVWYEDVTMRSRKRGGGGSDDEEEQTSEETKINYGPAIALFHNPSGDDTEPHPMPGQVKWIGYFEPTQGESGRKVEREVIQRRDLKVMLDYLDEEDPEELARMDGVLNNPRASRRYQFWLDAKFLKDQKRKVKQQARRRKEKNRHYAEMLGVDPTELEDTEDEGFEIDEREQEERIAAKKRKRGDMPPPLRPGQGNKKQKSKAAGGRANRANGRGARPPQTPDNLFVSPLLMSGGRGTRRDGSHGSASRSQSVDILNGREDSYDSFDFDPRAPQPENGSPAHGLGGNYAYPSVETVTDSSDNETVARLRRIAELNGDGIDEDAEVDRIIRETSLDRFGGLFGDGHGRGATGRTGNRGSSALWDDLNGGLDEEAAEREAVRASMAPEDTARRNGATGPFEADDSDTNGATGVDGEVGGSAQSNNGGGQNGGVGADGENGIGEDGVDGDDAADEGEGDGEGEGG